MENVENMGILKAVFKTAAAGIVALCFLSLFALCYDYSGNKISDSSGATDVKWDGRQFVSSYVEGGGTFITDENGYNNLSYISNPEILIMGDSHIEARQVSQNQNLVSQLSECLGVTCYNIGQSSHFISICADNIESALSVYNPEEYVVIDTYTISPDYEEMVSVMNGSRTRAKTSAINDPLYFIRKIPCFGTIKYQLERWAAVEKTQILQEENSYSDKEYNDRLRCILRTIATAANKHDVKPIIFYHPFEKLNCDGTVDYQTTQEELSRFQSICDDENIIFVDMTEDFQRLFDEEHVLAHGFINTAVGTGHLNKYGHRAIAERLAKTIMEDMQ